MFRIRKRYWLVMLLVGSIGLFAVAISLSQDGVARANRDKIKEGMTESDVEAILGEPGDYTGWPKLYGGDTVFPDIRPMRTDAYWIGDDGIILVGFERDKGVTARSFGPEITTEARGFGGGFGEKSCRAMTNEQGA